VSSVDSINGINAINAINAVHHEGQPRKRVVVVGLGMVGIAFM
jgi:hypothetical protein